jgi:hypothetical protein
MINLTTVANIGLVLAGGVALAYVLIKIDMLVEQGKFNRNLRNQIHASLYTITAATVVYTFYLIAYIKGII